MEGEEGRIERRALRVRHIAPEIGSVHRIVVLTFKLTVAADRRFLRITAELLPIRVIDKRGNRGRTGDLLEELFFLCGQGVLFAVVMIKRGLLVLERFRVALSAR